MKSINFVTGNKNKLAEVQAILQGTIEVKSVSVDVPELQGTIEDIAREKCRKAAEAVSSYQFLVGTVIFPPWSLIQD